MVKNDPRFKKLPKVIDANLIAVQLDVHLPRARSIKFAEINALPRPKHQVFLVDEDFLAASYNRRLQVSVGVAFRVAEPDLACLGSHLPQNTDDVRSHIRVSVFINGHTGSRVWYEYATNALSH
jgi:hypothetical protein